MKNRITQLKKYAIALITLPLFALILLNSVNAKTETTTTAEASDPAATYTAKCKMCHGAKAEKLFDASKADDLHVEVILKGKKAEKPPNMPGYEAKGMTSDEAKALAAYMKSLRQ